MPAFSEHEGLRPTTYKEIIFREDLPRELRQPIVDIFCEYASQQYLAERVVAVFNPYGLENLSEWMAKDVAVAPEDSEKFFAAKRILFGCPWYRLYDLVEDIVDCISFFEKSEFKS